MYNIIGSSKKIRKVKESIKTVIEHDLPVLIFGETGVGKELVARALHFHGPRKEEIFCGLNASCFSEDLAESELFGHVRGAFTGAIRDREGKFAFANRGTIFLDEISCMSLKIQAKILRVIEDKTFQKMGSNETLSTNARIISASNLDLQREVSQRNLREDLFYRLAVFPIEVPPLRERKGDIPELCRYFLKNFCDLIKCEEKSIDKETMDLLVSYYWPGNIRELQNSLGRAVLLANANGNCITPKHFKFSDDCHSDKILSMHEIVNELDKGKIFKLQKVVFAYVKQIFDDNNENLSETANLLGITRTTLYRKLNMKP
ncbi:MAG: sigma-54 interaction domain-containing protein [Candidatus Paceibacteria bacterium]